jgi:hypothetical protein
VVGANGRLGRAVMAAATQSGHDAAAVGAERGAELVGLDAVVCVTGPTPSHPGDTVPASTRALIDGMVGAGVTRLVVVTGAMVGAPGTSLSWVYRLIRSMPSVASQLGPRREQERAVMGSGLRWTIARPARLHDGPPCGVRAGETIAVGALATTSRPALAAWLVAACATPAWEGRAVTVVDR